LAAWAAQTSLPTRLGVKAEALTSQHFWDQMDALPVAAVEEAERAVVSKLLQAEALAPGLLAYDTTNFYTHLESTKGRSAATTSNLGTICASWGWRWWFPKKGRFP